MTNYCADSQSCRKVSQTKRYAAELTSGTGHDRFDFTVKLILDGLQR